MTLPTSGTISASMINLELGRASGAAFSLGGEVERALAGKTTGAISMADFYGKSSIIREPPQGEIFDFYNTYWFVFYSYYSSGHAFLRWQGVQTPSFSLLATQYDYSGWRYFRGEYVTGNDDDIEVHSIYRIKL